MKKKSEVINDAVRDWKHKIEGGIKYRKRYSTSAKWDQWRRYYRGQFEPEVIPVNKVFSYGRMMVPRVYFRAPKVCVTATRPELIWHAQVVEAIDNMLIKEAMLKGTIKKAVVDAFLCGIGPIKLGYDSEFGYLPQQAIGDDGSTVTQVSRKDETRIEYRESVRPGMPWAARVMPEHVVVPWGTTDSNNFPWIAHYILRPLDDVQQDQKYRNTKDLKGTRQPNKDMSPGVTRTEPAGRDSWEKDIPYCELWEIRDFKAKRILVICEDQLLLDEVDVLQEFDSLPWEFLTFNEDPEYFWPIPDIVNIIPQQEELNEIRTQASRHREIALLKFLYKRGTLTEDELQKFLTGEVGPAVGIDGDTPIGSAIMPLQPHIPVDFDREKASVLQDMVEGLGFSPNQMGQFSPRHNTSAREAGIVNAGFEERVDERKDIVSDLLVNIIRKWNQYIFSFWSKERVIQIVTPKGEPFWIKYTGDQIKGDYLLSIEPDSGIPVNRMLKYQMAKEIFGTFNGDQMIDQMKLRMMLLSNYAVVDPLAETLLTVPPLGPQMEGLMRQPHPMRPGQGQGQGGPQESPSGPKQPIPLDQLRAQGG
jgi:hypothetical protein